MSARGGGGRQSEQRPSVGLGAPGRSSLGIPSIIPGFNPSSSTSPSVRGTRPGSGANQQVVASQQVTSNMNSNRSSQSSPNTKTASTATLYEQQTITNRNTIILQTQVLRLQFFQVVVVEENIVFEYDRRPK